MRAARFIVTLGAILLAGCGGTSPGAGDAGLVQATRCRAGTPAADPAPAVVTVQIPPTALVRVDHRGDVIAAWTNTGCAPGPADDIWVEGPDGTIHRGDAAALALHPWIGDFTRPGVFASQVRQR